MDIEVFANDRNGLLSDVIKEIGNTKAKLLAVNAKTNKERVATIEITIEVENIEVLNQIVRTLRKIESVYDVKRKK